MTAVTETPSSAAPAHPAAGWRARLTQRWLGTITHFRTREPVVALTFDDGPDPDVTPRLLALLQEHHALATFFMVGDAAVGAHDLLRQMASAGHAIGNHTWSHRSVARLPRPERRHEMHACARAIAPFGHRLFRPPWGEQTMASRLDALLLGYEVFGWNVEAGDWWNPDAAEMARSLTRRIHPGCIVLLHDHIRSEATSTGSHPVLRQRNAMLAALHLVLDQHGDRYRFVTLPEMFQHGTPVRRIWFIDPTRNASTPASAS